MLFDSTAFKVWSTTLALMLVILWLIMVAFTLRALVLRKI
jgi:hypothetical protein